MTNAAKLTDIVLRIAENDDQLAFKYLHKIFFAGLFSFSLSITKNKQISEEVIEDVFVNVWNNRRTIPTINNISNYLYTSVKYGSLNAIKTKHFSISKQNINFEEIGEEYLKYNLQTPEEKIISAENLRLINEAIDSLPSKCRLVFRLVKEEGLKYSEVASLLNISVRTVHNHMLNATATIFRQLKLLLPEFLPSRMKNRF